MENEGERGKGSERTKEGKAAKVPGTALERRTPQEGSVMGSTGAGKSAGVAAELNRILHSGEAPRPVILVSRKEPGSSGGASIVSMDEPHRIIRGEPGHAERIVAMFQTLREPTVTWQRETLGGTIQSVGGSINPFEPGPGGPSDTARKITEIFAREYTRRGESGRPQTPETRRPTVPQRPRPRG